MTELSATLVLEHGLWVAYCTACRGKDVMVAGLFLDLCIVARELYICVTGSFARLDGSLG
jgi:hypothetical protein